MKALATAFDTLEKKEAVTNSEATQAVDDAFGARPDTLALRGSLNQPISSLKDSLIAIKLLPEEHERPIEQLSRQLRDLETILQISKVDDFPAKGAVLWRYRRRSFRLPDILLPPSALSNSEQEKEEQKRREEEEKKRRENAQKKFDLYKHLGTTVEVLKRLGTVRDNIQSTPQRPAVGFMVAPQWRPVQVFSTEMGQRQHLSQLNLLRTELNIRNESGAAGATGTPTPATRTIPNVELGPKVEGSAFPALKLQNGTGEFTPLLPGEASFRLKPAVELQMPEASRASLKERGLAVSERPLDQIVESLRSEQTALAKELESLFGRPTRTSLKRIGNTLVKVATPLASDWTTLVLGSGVGTLTGPPLPLDPRVPHSHGKVAPSGMADLLIIKQQLIKYEAADVAHIESILKGEKKDREHSRRRETEEVTFRESETTTTEERELESTNRFEMSRETENTLREDASLKAGLTLSGRYGPTVDFSASAEGSLDRTKEEATKTAAKFSQEVTERSSRKITERVLQRASLRVTNEVIEKNLHTLDNTDGPANISGVYQWVNKVYEAQMFNYGLRTMFDFTVPEPGAFLIAALEKSHAHAMELERPLPFTLRPNEIDEINYHTYVSLYRATDVTPPPDEYKTKSFDFKAGGGDDSTDYDHSGQIVIDEGYQAVHGSVGKVANIWEDAATVDVVLGKRTHRFPKGDWMWSTDLDLETDSIPFALNTYKISHVAIAGEVKCQRTERAMRKWRHETHAKLTQAYKVLQADYEEKLANLEMQVGVAIKGKSPALNLQLMKDELRKNCVAILTDQHFERFGAVATGSHGLPESDLYENEAEGPYVRFIEQAFEWEHMTWVTYPYFWGRKSQWESKVSYEENDPEFNQFLKAGYCRVVVPARPGFEALSITLCILASRGRERDCRRSRLHSIFRSPTKSPNDWRDQEKRFRKGIRGSSVSRQHSCISAPTTGFPFGSRTPRESGFRNKWLHILLCWQDRSCAKRRAKSSGFGWRAVKRSKGLRLALFPTTTTGRSLQGLSTKPSRKLF